MKILRTKWIALALCLLILLPALTACGGTKVNDDGVTLLKKPVVIAGGDTTYTIAKPQTSTDTYSACVSQLSNPVEGFTLANRIAKEDDGFAGEAEILLGNTCREETKTAMDAIGYDDFSITYINNKIVIAAHTPQRLEEAVTFFKEKLLQVRDGKLEYIGDYHFVSNAALLIGEGESLSDYKIVCGDPSNLYSASITIQRSIEEMCGVTLEIIFPNQGEPGEREIVIGAPREGMSVSSEQIPLGEALIAVEGKSLLITARESITATQAAEFFAEEYLSGNYSNQFNLKADFSITGNMYEDDFRDKAARANGTEVRVMSFNILVDIWSDTPQVKGRDTTAVQTILYYTPDVMGLQEASATWHRNLKLYLKGTPYQLVCTDRSVSDSKYGKNNFTPILYNSETVTLLDSGVKEYVSKTNQYLRTMSWAYFQCKASGEKFILLNTHFDAPGNNEEEKAENLASRKKQSVELIEFLKELESTYNCPVMVTGDFNTTEGSDKEDKHLPYWYLRDNGLHDAKFSADKIQRQPATWHNLGSMVSSSKAGSFDHVFGTERVSFKYFNTLIDKQLMSASDHCPVYADAVLN